MPGPVARRSSVWIVTQDEGIGDAIIGVFDSRAEAEEYLADVAQRNPDAGFECARYEIGERVI